MIYGIAPIEACLRAGKRSVEELLLKPNPTGRLLSLQRLAAETGVAWREAPIHELGNLARTKQHQGAVLRCGELPTVELEDLVDANAGLLVALDQVEDPQNLGGIARSAQYFGAGGLVLLRARSAPLSAAASKASAGTLESLPIARVGNLAQALRKLRDHGYQIAGADPGNEAIPAERWSPTARSVLVLGAEGSGLRRLSRELCDQLLRIEGGGAESLNVSVSAGILLNIWRKQLGNQGVPE